MASDFLSEIELYYTPAGNLTGDSLSIMGEEMSHIVRVMRHTEGDELYVTDGEGKILKCMISNIAKDQLTASIQESYNYENNFSNIFFCIPKLKSPERFEFALEKSVELGITNFIVFNAKRSIRKSDKSERWNKVLINSMKQSLRSYLPVLKTVESLAEVAVMNGKKILFDQKAGIRFSDNAIDKTLQNFLIFGPEGGLCEEEIRLVKEENIYSLTANRLRAETAIVTAASLLHAAF